MVDVNMINYIFKDTKRLPEMVNMSDLNIYDEHIKFIINDWSMTSTGMISIDFTIYDADKYDDMIENCPVIYRGNRVFDTKNLFSSSVDSFANEIKSTLINDIAYWVSLYHKKRLRKIKEQSMLDELKKILDKFSITESDIVAEKL